jgi:hypothetical protein
MTSQGVDGSGTPIDAGTIAPDPDRARLLARSFMHGVRFGIRLGIRIAAHRDDAAEVDRLLVGTGLDRSEIGL